MMIKVKELFHIKYGNQLDLNKQNITTNKNGINFINRSSVNLGVTCLVKKIDKVTPFEQGLITVALGGSMLSTYIQPKEFYTGQNVKVLKPRQNLSYRQKAFYCLCIKRNAYKYSAHGREANKTLGDILIPSPKEIPTWVHNISLPKTPSKEPHHYKQVSLKDRKWAWFKFKDIFVIKGTKTAKIEELESYGQGKYPYITTQSVNNGTRGFYNFSTEEKKAITVDSAVVGYASYQEQKFSASDHVEILRLQNINVFKALFLTTIINKEQYRYSYGRKRSQTKLKKEKIKLPINQYGKPDWALMEYYIKSLPYSSNLKDEKSN